MVKLKKKNNDFYKVMIRLYKLTTMIIMSDLRKGKYIKYQNDIKNQQTGYSKFINFYIFS